MENPALWSVALPRLRLNLYLILGCSPEVPVTSLRRALRSLRFHLPEPGLGRFPWNRPSWADALDQLERRLDDPMALWVDEFFCPWRATRMDAQTTSPSDRAFFAREALAAGPEDPVLQHDFAVTRMLEVADIEGNPSCGREGWNRRRKGAWSEALESWAAFVTKPEFWEANNARIREKGDPRLLDFLQEVSTAALVQLPLALVARQKLSLFIGRGRADLPALDCVLDGFRDKVAAAGMDLQSPWRHCLSELEVRQDVLLRCVRLQTESWANGEVAGADKLDQVITDTERHIELLDLFQVANDEAGRQIYDALGDAQRDLLIAYGNATENWEPYERCGPLMESHAFGPALKKRIAGDWEAIRDIRLSQSHRAALHRLRSIAEETSALVLRQAKEVEMSTRLVPLQRLLTEALDEKFFLEEPRITKFHAYKEACDEVAQAGLEVLFLALQPGASDARLVSLVNICRSLAVSEVVRDRAQQVINRVRALFTLPDPSNGGE